MPNIKNVLKGILTELEYAVSIMLFIGVIEFISCKVMR